MADIEKKVLVDVEVAADASLASIAQLTKELGEAKAAQKEYKKAGKEASEEAVENKLNIESLNRSIREQSKELRNADIARKAATGSIKQLAAEVSILTARYAKMDPDSAQGKETIMQLEAKRTALTELRKEYGDNRMEVGNYEIATKSVRSEIRLMTEELTRLLLAGEQNSAEYIEMTAKLAQYKDAMGDVALETSTLASDTAKLDTGVQAIKLLTAGMAALQGMAALAGTENKVLANTIKTLQTATGALVAIVGIQTAIQKETLVYKKADLILTKLGIDQTVRATKAEAAYTTMKGGGTVATKAIAAATWLWNAALAANPVILIATALVTLVAGVRLLTGAFKSNTTEAEKAAEANAWFEKQLKATENAIRRINDAEKLASEERSIRQSREMRELKASGATKKQLLALELKQQQENDAAAVAASNRRIKQLDEQRKVLLAEEIVEKRRLWTTKQGTAEYREQEAAIADIIAKREALISLMSEEALTGDKLAEQRKQEEASRIEAAKNAAQDERLRALDNEEKIARIKLSAQAKYQNDLNKSTEENELARFNVEQKYAEASERQANDFARRRLALQLKYRQITLAEFNRQEELIRASEAESNRLRIQKAEEFTQSKIKALTESLGASDEDQMANIRATYERSLQLIEEDTNLSERRKAYYRIRLEEERAVQIEALRKASADRLQKQNEKYYENDLRAAEGSILERQRIEIKALESLIARKKQGGLDTFADDVRLLGLRASLIQNSAKQELAIGTKTAKEIYDIRKAALEAELLLNAGRTDETIRINNEILENERTLYDARVQQAQQAAQAIQGILSAGLELFKEQAAREVAAIDASEKAKKKALEKRLNAGVISQEQYDSQVGKIEEEAEARRVEIAREIAKREKAVAIFSAFVNTAVGVTKALSSAPPPFNFILAGLVAAAGALQIAAIASQPLPTSEGGGSSGGGSSAGLSATAIPSASPVPDAGYAYENRQSAQFDYAQFAEVMASEMQKVNVQVAVTDIKQGEANFAQVTNIGNIR